MTHGVTKTSVGERRLARFLRLCDYVIYFGLGSSAFGFVLQNVRVMGLTLVVVSFGAVVKLAGVIVAYLLMSSRTPNADIAPWIRRWTRTASGIAGLAALWVNAESRYHRAHGSYSDDIAELRRLGSSLIDSLVVVAVDARRYRAIATDPGGRVSCGLWSAARIGERTPLQIEGAGAGELVCWTPSDSAKKAAR